MRWSEKPRCHTCKYYDQSTDKPLGGIEAARLYTRDEENGGICQRASTPFRQPRNGVCACYIGPALPWWTKICGPYTQIKVLNALALESLDNLAIARDDAAVLRCALSGVWRRVNEARAKSHELWSFLRPAFESGSLPDAATWRPRFVNATTVISRLLSSLGDMASFSAIREAGIQSVGIIVPERDTGSSCHRCGSPLNTEVYLDIDKAEICRDCAASLGLLGD